LTRNSLAYINLEEMAGDQIVLLIQARLKEHDQALLVEAILQAEGYTTYRSPEGVDGGATSWPAGVSWASASRRSAWR
jgi:hypothetical protein